jgi:hypothetical protein
MACNVLYSKDSPSWYGGSRFLPRRGVRDRTLTAGFLLVPQLAIAFVPICFCYVANYAFSLLDSMWSFNKSIQECFVSYWHPNQVAWSSILLFHFMQYLGFVTVYCYPSINLYDACMRVCKCYLNLKIVWKEAVCCFNMYQKKVDVLFIVFDLFRVWHLSMLVMSKNYHVIPQTQEDNLLYLTVSFLWKCTIEVNFYD